MNTSAIARSAQLACRLWLSGTWLAASVLLGQTTSFGDIGEPQPAMQGGKRFPGCTITFGSPSWPSGVGPDFACAMTCSGPGWDAPMTPEDAAGRCRTAGPNNGGVVVRGPDGEEIAPIDVPPGSSECEMHTGPRGYPNNWTSYYPRGHPACRGVTGEPHLFLSGGVRFDFQAAGEFIAARSIDDDFEVQMRLEPYAINSDRLSVATAVAAKLGEHRVMISARGHVPLRVDGRPLEMPDNTYRFLSNSGAVIVRTDNRYSLVWRDGTNIHVDLHSKNLNLYVIPSLKRDGRLAGILGDVDAEESPFRTRDGRGLGAEPDFDTLYKVFGKSWRIGQDESLFDYAEGESTATFTILDRPVVEVTMDDLDPADRRAAEQRCRAAGIGDPAALEECTFDVALTGDEGFIESAASLEPPPEFRDDEQQTVAAEPADVQIELADEAFAGHKIEVRITGGAAGHMLGFAPAGSPNAGKTTNPYSAKILKTGDEVIELAVPTAPGRYELRYRVARGPRTILARKPFRSLAPDVEIEAPTTAQTRGSLELRVQGDVGEHMVVQIVPKGSEISASGPGSRLHPDRGPSAIVRRLPSEPGDYEIRVVSPWGAGKQVYAIRALTIH